MFGGDGALFRETIMMKVEKSYGKFSTLTIRFDPRGGHRRSCGGNRERGMLAGFREAYRANTVRA